MRKILDTILTIPDNIIIYRALLRLDRDITFALDISNKLKTRSKLSDKEKTNMGKCWEQAVKKGFVDSKI